MDKKKSIINVFVGIAFKIAILIVTILSRRFLIQIEGNEANGVIALFTSIISFLSITELGVGSAITFCMYKPIVEGDDKKVAALYNLFKKCYLVFAVIVLVVGLALTPLISFLAKDYTLDYNLYLLYIIQLVSTVVTYFGMANISLINAYKNNYVTTTINSVFILLKLGLQILVLFLTKSLYFYLGIVIITEAIQVVFIFVYTRRKYYPILSLGYERIDNETKTSVVKNVKALFLHKVGAIFVNTIDNVVISAILGVVILGYYSNYSTIAVSLTSVIVLVFHQLISVVGHAYQKSDPEKYHKYFKFFYLLNYFIASFSFICYFACITPFINFFFGEGLLLSEAALFVITINFFIQYMEQAATLFKDSAGLFYNDRYKSIFEAILNLGLSIAFVYWIGVVGVIVGTIITNVLICHIVEPFVLYKHGFKTKPTRYFVFNYLLIGAFVGLMFAYYYINQIAFDNYLVQFFINGLIASLFSLPSLILFLVYSHKHYNLFGLLKERLRKRKMERC